MIRTFRGGVHPNDNKSATAEKPVEIVPLPEKFIVPLRQHIGAPCAPVVAVGDVVMKGQLIAKSEAFVSSPIHAPTSGKVKEIGIFPHSVFGTCSAVVIEADGLDQWCAGIPARLDWQSLSVDEMRTSVYAAGLIGMGGATFPTHVKLSPPKEQKIDTFILNAAECEPYLTSDYRAMIEQPHKIITGVLIVMKILGVKRGLIGIEENKPNAIKLMRELCGKEEGLEVVALKTKYPQGAEKTLIQVLTGREVPSGKLPGDAGVMVQNVATVMAVVDAVVDNKPLIERICTVSGGAISEPKNLKIRIGMTFKHLIDFCGGFKEEPAKLLLGGPMMGIAQSTLDVPVIKGTGGILALSKKEVNFAREHACVRCGKCLTVCPMGLIPSMLSILSERGAYQVAKDEYDLLDCVECGSCVYVCPAKRNIVHYVRLAKLQNANLTAKK